MTATYKPLSSEERRDLLRALNEASREIFTGLLAPVEHLARADKEGGDSVLRLDDLPSEVISEVSHGCSNRLITVLVRHFSNTDGATFKSVLDALVRPAIMRVRRIDEADVAVLWQTFVESHVEYRLYLDLFLALAKGFCDEAWNDSPASFVETSVLKNVFCWPGDTMNGPGPLPPGHAFAIRQVLKLALESEEIELPAVLSWALRTGDFTTVSRLLRDGLSNGETPEPRKRTEWFAQLSKCLDGLLVYMHDYLDEYLHALADNEDCYFARVNNKRGSRDDKPGGVPSLKELKDLSVRLAAGRLPRRASVEKWGIGAIELYNHLNWEVFAPLRQLLPVLFYLEKDVFFSALGSRLVEQIERWLCYWVCMGHRHGRQEMNFKPAEVAAQRLVLEVVQSWHSESDGMSLLSRARRLLNEEPVRSWSLEYLRPEENSRLAFYLLPLWLLELRALRLHGRGSPEWHEANSLAEERFAFLACRVDLAEWWHHDPRTLLFTLEAVRQLAVARCESGNRGQWDPEIRRCAQQILVRLETIDDARVRRALSAFFHPVLTSIAAWATAASDDPLEGLCLFEMARSRWFLDHLGLADRTLQVKANDPEKVRQFKDQLFDALCPRLDPYALSEWENVPQNLIVPLAGEFPNLARLAASNWLSPTSVCTRIPRDAVILAYELEHDPGDPPTILLKTAEEPWPAVCPGPGARLWMFLLHAGKCHHCVCSITAQKLQSRITELQSVNQRCLIKIDGQTAFHWRDEDVVAYESGLSELGNVLLAPWKHDGRLPRGELSLLIIPSGKLFELPWAAMPLGILHQRLIDVAHLGVMPGLGLALWSSALQSPPATLDAEVFLQAASPELPAGLMLPPQFIERFRGFRMPVSEGANATPWRVMEALQRRNLLIFLCHGEVDVTAYLQLYPPGTEGRLTTPYLDHLPPVDHVALVMLGCCWGGIEVLQAAEQAEGLTSTLLLKGVRSVISGIGMIPIGLIAETAAAVLTTLKTLGRNGESVRALRNAQLRVRNEPAARGTNFRRHHHPWNWAALTYHGVPWD